MGSRAERKASCHWDSLRMACMERPRHCDSLPQTMGIRAKRQQEQEQQGTPAWPPLQRFLSCRCCSTRHGLASWRTPWSAGR